MYSAVHLLVRWQLEHPLPPPFSPLFICSLYHPVSAQITVVLNEATQIAHDAASPDLVCLLVSQRQCQQEWMQAGCAACSACAEQSRGRQVYEVGVQPSVEAAGCSGAGEAL